ncbi:MAG: copper amine oxidase N-terminal domain-containing protein [Clostridia bacterium]|nr:copper amine oxidase N-terminal domain-containing protein [Clostridia bacterium]
MKNTLKKIVVPVAALSLLATAGVFATEVSVDAEPPVLISAPAEIDVLPVINGASVDGVPVVVENDIVLIPLRSVAEGLGYTVTWHEEDQSITLEKGAQYIRMAIGEDSYSFGRRAPQSLGTAPVLVDDCVTHVPLSFIPEIIGGYYSVNEDGTYKIVNPSIVTVTEVTEDGILVNDSSLGDVLVRIDENTVIVNNEGNTEDASLIAKDMTLGVEYSPAMTASIPAQTTAIKIIIENLPVDMPEVDAEVQPEEAVSFSGVITEIDGESVLIGKADEAGSVRLIVTENTEIKHEMNRRAYRLEDLEVGMTISGTHSGAATFSIPPQSEAFSIVIGK